MIDKTKKCTQCQTDIPFKAKKCPNCKSDLRSFAARHPIITIIGVLFLIGTIGNMIGESTVKNNQGNVNTSTISGVTQQTATEEDTKKIETISKVEVVSKSIKEIYGYPHLELKLKNNTGRDIDAVVFTAQFENNFGELLKETISGNEYFRGSSQDTIKKGQTVNWEWQLSLFEHATKVKSLEIVKIHFKDGETIDLGK